MGDVLEDIKEGLTKFSSKFGPNSLLSAKVVEVNDDDDTITVELNTGVVVEDVRLKPVIISSDHWVLVPKIGTDVLVSPIENSDEFVVQSVNEVALFKSKIGNTTIKIDSNGFLIQRGNETLKKILNDLIDACKGEKHQTNSGVTISLIPSSVSAFEGIKTRVSNLLT